jgi:hypothetical protein
LWPFFALIRTDRSRVDVNINTVCPGLVSSDLGRSIVKMSKLMQVLVPVHTGFLGKSADFGARLYISAARTSRGEHVSSKPLFPLEIDVVIFTDRLSRENTFSRGLRTMSFMSRAYPTGGGPVWQTGN